MQIYSADTREHVCCDYCGAIPSAASLDNCSPANTMEGPLAAVVPGSPAGWLGALEKFGSLAPAAVRQPKPS